MSWQIIPVLEPVRGPQPEGVPARPAVPYEPCPTGKRRAWGRDVTDLSAPFRTARSARACINHQKGNGA